jgi:hypothetical protein
MLSNEMLTGYAASNIEFGSLDATDGDRSCSSMRVGYLEQYTRNTANRPNANRLTAVPIHTATHNQIVYHVRYPTLYGIGMLHQELRVRSVLFEAASRHTSSHTLAIVGKTNELASLRIGLLLVRVEHQQIRSPTCNNELAQQEGIDELV